MENTSEQIRENVDKYLSAIYVRFEVRYVGETVHKRAGSADWPCDAWRVGFIRGKAKFETDYFTGLGLRKPKTGIARCSYPKNTVGYANWEKQYRRPVEPCAADVMHSLALDSEAADMSFTEWCSDFGYSDDSISALNTYQACCKIAADLLKLFSRKELETLRDMVREY